MSTEDENNDINQNVVKFPGKNRVNKNMHGGIPGMAPLTAAETAALINNITNSEMLKMTTINPEDFDTNEDYLRRINIENLCNTFAMEIYFRLLNMGYTVNTQEFAKDLEFAQEAINSALLRTFQVEHPIQEYIDENFELITVQTTTQELDT